jgi:hypothetical protein
VIITSVDKNAVPNRIVFLYFTCEQVNLPSPTGSGLNPFIRAFFGFGKGVNLGRGK